MPSHLRLAALAVVTVLATAGLVLAVVKGYDLYADFTTSDAGEVEQYLAERVGVDAADCERFDAERYFCTVTMTNAQSETCTAGGLVTVEGSELLWSVNDPLRYCET